MGKIQLATGVSQTQVPVLPPPVIAGRAPISTDTNYSRGQLWFFKTSSLFYIYEGGGLWTPFTDSDGPVLGVNGTTNQITSTNTAGTVTLSLPSAITTPGSLTTTTSLTATLGNITATNGNIVKGTAGNKDVYTSVASTTAAGANSAGTVTLVAGTATIATTSVTAASKIRIYRQGVGATGAAALGILTIGTITAGTSFVITAVQPANATAAQTTDVSVVFWEIVN